MKKMKCFNYVNSLVRIFLGLILLLFIIDCTIYFNGKTSQNLLPTSPTPPRLHCPLKDFDDNYCPIEPNDVLHFSFASNEIKCEGAGCIIEMSEIIEGRKEMEEKIYTKLEVSSITLNANQSLIITNFRNRVEIQNKTFHIAPYLNDTDNTFQISPYSHNRKNPFFINYKLYDISHTNLISYGYLSLNRKIYSNIWLVEFISQENLDLDTLFYKSILIGTQNIDCNNVNLVIYPNIDFYCYTSHYTTTLDPTTLQNNSLSIPRKFWLNNNWATGAVRVEFLEKDFDLQSATLGQTLSWRTYGITTTTISRWSSAIVYQTRIEYTGPLYYKSLMQIQTPFYLKALFVGIQSKVKLT